MALKTNPRVLFHSADHALELGFDRLKQQALHFVYEGYPVGDYYEAALPNRDAFCMRDVSHQCTGAEVLGLSNHNRNMFLKFAQGISESKDWCSHWEIDRFDRSCPVDYTDDHDFWYNLPANFDVLHACWRMYQWTGDQAYLSHPDHDYFYAQSMEAYIHRWDRDGDGLPDRDPTEGRRGLCTYDESTFATRTLLVGTDLLAVMARAHLSYAAMCGQLGRREQERIYRKRGEALLQKLNVEWHDAAKGYAKGLDQEHELIFVPDEHNGAFNLSFMLYWDTMLDHPERLAGVVEAFAQVMEKQDIECFSHYPELLFRYGQAAQGVASLRRAMRTDLPRKEYPELSFCAIGAVATGLMGLQPEASANTLRTLSNLADVEWAELCHVPVLGGELAITHAGNTSTLTREHGPALIWQPAFHGKRTLRVSGTPLDSRQIRDPFTGETLTLAEVPVGAGETATVSAE